MSKLKNTVISGIASLALVMGVALPASAATQSTYCSSRAISANICPNINVNNSRTWTRSMGSGSAIIRNNVDQRQFVGSSTTQLNLGFSFSNSDGGDGTGVGVGILGFGTGVGVGGASTSTSTNSQTNWSSTTSTGMQSNNVIFAPRQ